LARSSGGSSAIAAAAPSALRGSVRSARRRRGPSAPESSPRGGPPRDCGPTPWAPPVSAARLRRRCRFHVPRSRPVQTVRRGAYRSRA
jgi:hypothetical protein